MNISVWCCQQIKVLLFYVDTSGDWVGGLVWRRHASFVNYTRNTSLASWVMSCNHGYCNKETIETTLTKHRCAGQRHKLSPALLHLCPIKHSPVFASSGWPVIHTVGTSRLTLLTLRVTVNYILLHSKHLDTILGQPGKLCAAIKPNIVQMACTYCIGVQLACEHFLLTQARWSCLETCFNSANIINLHL